MQRPSVRKNVYRSTDPPSIRYEKTRASIRTLIFFQALFAGPRSFLDTIFESITNKAKRVELLMLYRIFFQRSEEDFQAKNARVLCRLQSSLANINVLGFYFFFEPNPSTPSFYLRSARLSPATTTLGCTPSTSASILEMRSGRRRPSPGSGWKCLMG